MATMFRALRRSVLPWTLTGVFLAVTVAGQPLHVQLASCDHPHPNRPAHAHGCAGNCSHSVSADRVDHGAPGTTALSRVGATHDVDQCVICQFFAKARAVAVGGGDESPPVPAVPFHASGSPLVAQATLPVYEARGPPAV